MISTTTNTQGAAILCEHEDGRYAVNPDTTGDPARHRLGPVDISALAASTQSGLTDAYAGAREDLSIWKRRALEAERDLRSEKQTTSRLVGELNAANGPAYMGEPAASPAYGATEYGWADYRRLQDGDKRLIALVVNLYGNDHQSSSDLEGLLDRASRWQVPAQQPEATHLRELAAYRLTVENLEREIAAITSETGNPASAQGAAITSESETQPAPALWVSPEQFANFMDADEAEFGKYIPARKTSAGKFTMPLFAARAQADSVTAPAGGAVSAPVFAFRRKGLDDFCTCTEERYAELSAKPNLFETRIFYTTPPTQAADSVLEDAARLERDVNAAKNIARFGLESLAVGAPA